MECSFDYDIKDHVRKDLYKALELAIDWYTAHDVITLTEKYVAEHREPCCNACVQNNG
jgi:endonuclease III